MFVRIENSIIDFEKVSSITADSEFTTITIKGEDIDLDVEYSSEELRDNHFEKLNDLLKDVTPDYISFCEGEAAIVYT